MKPQPWSEQRERLLGVAHRVCMYLVLGLFAGTAGAVIRGKWTLAGILVGMMIAAIGVDVVVMDALSTMNKNKPLGDRRVMTTWTQWPAEQNTFSCGCGRHLSFVGVPGEPGGFSQRQGIQPACTWSPNEGRQGSDPGGGRWCMVCPCGRGHFKFNFGSYAGTGGKP